MDEIRPNRLEPPPIDNDDESVAPPTKRSPSSIHLPGGQRPLKGGYWFIREMYRAEVDAAIAKDKEKLIRPPAELEAPLGLAALVHRMALEDQGRHTPIVSQSRRASEISALPGLTVPEGPPVDPLDPNQRRPRFGCPPLSITWPFPPT